MRIDLREGGDPVELALPLAVGESLRESPLVNATPTVERDRWSIAPAGFVGVARVAGVELWIAPKIPIARLFFLIGFTRDHRGWREEDLQLHEDEDLIAALATAFARQADRATRQGLLQGYRVEEDSSPVLRGRVRTADQLKRRFGFPLPLEIRYDEFGVDIAENQLLRSAAAVLLRIPGIGLHSRRMLLHLMRLTADVTPLSPGDRLPTWQPTRLNARYQVALRLAELALRGASIEQADGAIAVNGFMLNMASVYEDFVTVALGEALTRRDGICRPQERWHLDEDDAVPMRPDLVWYSNGTGEPSAIIDAKYKAEKPSGFPNADLYQMLAYCTVAGLNRGHLVYAKGNEPALTHVVRRSGVTITQHALDLDQNPTALLAQIDRLAGAIADQQRGPLRCPAAGSGQASRRTRAARLA